MRSLLCAISCIGLAPRCSGMALARKASSVFLKQHRGLVARHLRLYDCDTEGGYRHCGSAQTSSPALQVAPKGDLVLVEVAKAEAQSTGGVLLPGSAQRKPTSGAASGECPNSAR